MSETENLYNQAFYDSQKSGSLKSAHLLLSHLWRYYQAKSVVDIGCGVGTWLTASASMGAQRIVGYDGEWNSQAHMIHPEIDFFAYDLNLPLPDHEKFDLAISLEVAEHLQPASSESFVNGLTGLSEVVIFGAAILGQGGTGHINERLHTEWGLLFSALDYQIYDLFRPVFWGHADVDVCYQQNAFLYVKSGHPLVKTLADAGLMPLENLQFMNCFHPRIYEVKYKKSRSLREKMDKPWPEIRQSLKKELGKFCNKLVSKI